MNKLKVEDIEMIANGELFKTDSKGLGRWEGGKLHQRLAWQLLDTLRENERLLNFKKCFGIANDSDGSKIVQISTRAQALQSYKDSEHVG